MPKRRNVFQDTVALIQRHIAGAANVEESAFLIDLVDGSQREVDVVIRTQVARQDVVVSVEAVGRKRRATVEWVEQMCAKHETLPTSKLVLVAQAGFSKQARIKAEQKGAIPVAPRDIESSVAARSVVGRLGTVWAKRTDFSLTTVKATVQRPDQNSAYGELDQVFMGDGTLLGTTPQLVAMVFEAEWNNVIQQIDLANITADQENDLTLTLQDPHVLTPALEPIFVQAHRPDGTTELHPITRLVVRGRLAVRVAEIPLVHAELHGVPYATGTGAMAGQDVLLVVTEDEHPPRATLRIRGASPEDLPLHEPLHESAHDE